MKSKQILDVQQMQHLQELGLDISNASMCYYKEEGWEANYFITLACDIREKGGLIYYYDSFSNKEYILSEVIPAYTLQDVLDALPEYIYDSTEQYLLEINMFFKYIRYSRFNDVLTKRNFDRTPIIDAAYELLVWAIENGYVETNKNE